MDIADAPARSRSRGAAADIPPADMAAWEALRECRKRLADENGVPPYVIFHDRTLRDMLAQRPATLDDMLAVSGVGEAKLTRYGQAFLDVLAASG